jgi:serine/threonine protein kinase
MSQPNLEGQKLGKFTILKELGRGAMGIVYQAHDDLDRMVALKILPPELTIDQTYIERFKREAKSAAAMHHPNVVTIFEVGELDKMHYISMHYVEGQTLTDLMQAEGAMSVERVVELLGPVGSALDAAHAKKIIHRDIKPSNIMISNDGNIYLTDFGLARMVDPAAAATSAGMLLGTPEYMSPEQAQGLSEIGYATDIYALGIVAYQMLSGTLPFAGETTMMSLFARLKDPPRPLHEALPTINPAVETAVMKALERDPANRYTQASALVAALQAAASGAPAAPAVGATIAIDRKSLPPTPRPDATVAVDRKSLPPTPRPDATVAVDRKSLPPTPMSEPADGGKKKVPMGTIIGVVLVVLLMAGGAGGAMMLMGSSNTQDPPAATPEPPDDEVAGAAAAGPEGSEDPTEMPTEDIPAEPTEVVQPDPIQNQLLFVSDRDDNRNIYLMNPDGSEQTQLTDTEADDTAPAVAPDGSQIAFVSGNDIYVMNADGSGMTNLTSSAGESNYPTWSPDGSQIAFVHDETIYVMNADGSGQEPVHNEAGTYRDLDWSPTEALLAFEFDDDIYIMALDDATMTNLTQSPDARDQTPAWSPDGTQIAFASDRDADTFDIFVMDADGRGIKPVTVDEHIDNAPTWSPDGQQLAFRTARDRHDEIYIINIDGSEPMNLTNSDGDDTAPVWSR